MFLLILSALPLFGSRICLSFFVSMPGFSVSRLDCVFALCSLIVFVLFVFVIYLVFFLYIFLQLAFFSRFLLLVLFHAWKVSGSVIWLMQFGSSFVCLWPKYLLRFFSSGSTFFGIFFLYIFSIPVRLCYCLSLSFGAVQTLLCVSEQYPRFWSVWGFLSFIKGLTSQSKISIKSFVLIFFFR